LTNAGGERQLLGGAVNEERAFHELATIIAGENAFAFKIKMRALETFSVDDALFRWIIRLHLFSFTPVSDAALASRSAFSRARLS
jgi:hypothetical protein